MDVMNGRVKLISNQTMSLLNSLEVKDNKTALSEVYAELKRNKSVTWSEVEEMYWFIRKYVGQRAEVGLFQKAMPIFKYCIEYTTTNGVNEASDDNIVVDLVLYLYMKLSDTKLYQQIKDMFVFVVRTCRHIAVIEIVVKKLYKEHSQYVIINTLNLFCDVLKRIATLEELSVSQQLLIQVGAKFLSHPSESICQIASKYVIELYRLVGNVLRKALPRDINERDRLYLEEEFAEIDKTRNNNKSKGNTKWNTSDIGVNVYEKVICNINNMKQVNDICNQIDRLDKLIENADEEMEIPFESVVAVINKMLSHKNVNVVIKITNTTRLLVLTYKTQFAHYLQPLVATLVNNVNHNNQQLRMDSFECVNCVIREIGMDVVIKDIVGGLSLNAVREEMLRLLVENATQLRKEHYMLIMCSLLRLLCHPLKELKQVCIELIVKSLTVVDKRKYYNEVSKLNGVDVNKVRNALDKIFSTCNDDSNLLITVTKVNKKPQTKRKNNNTQGKAVLSLTPDKYSCKTKRSNVQLFRKEKEGSTISSINNNNNSVNNNNSITSYVSIIQESEGVYKGGIDFVEMRNNRNYKDMKLNSNFISIKDEHINEDITFIYLSLVFTESFIVNVVNKQSSLLDVLKLFVSLLEGTSKHKGKLAFETHFFPNYDLVLKYFIKKITAENINDITVFEQLHVFFNTFYEKICSLKLMLGKVEQTLTLQMLLEVLKMAVAQTKNNDLCKSLYGLIGKYVNAHDKAFSYEIAIAYSLHSNSLFIKQVVLDLFIDGLSQEDVDVYEQVRNVKELVKMVYCGNAKVNAKVRKVFTMCVEMIGEDAFNGVVLNGMNWKEQNVVTKILSEHKVKGLSLCATSNQRFNTNINNKSFDEGCYRNGHKLRLDNEVSCGMEVTFRHKNAKANVSVNTSTNTFALALKTVQSSANVAQKQNAFKQMLTMCSESEFISANANQLQQTIPLVVEAVITETQRYFNMNSCYVNCALQLLLVLTQHKLLMRCLNETQIYNIIVMLLSYVKQEDVSYNSEDVFDTVEAVLRSAIVNVDVMEVITMLLEIVRKEGCASLIGSNAVSWLSNAVEKIKCYSARSKVSDNKVGKVLLKCIEILNRITNANKKENEGIIRGIRGVIRELVLLRNEDICKDYEAIRMKVSKDKKVNKWINECLLKN